MADINKMNSGEQVIPESALWSEKSLSKTWFNKEEDEAWKDL